MTNEMALFEARKIYNNPPMYSGEIGRYVSAKGATYRAWRNGECHIPDNDAEERKYGQEGMNFGRWKD